MTGQELQQFLAEVTADSAAARGRSLQVEELQRQVNEHVLQRGQMEAELARHMKNSFQGGEPT